MRNETLVLKSRAPKFINTIPKYVLICNLESFCYAVPRSIRILFAFSLQEKQRKNEKKKQRRTNEVGKIPFRKNSEHE